MSQQLQYTNTFPAGLVGDIATARPYTARARVYPKAKHTVDVAVGGNTNGTYTVRISTPAGMRPVDAVDSPFVASSSTVDLIGAGLADAINEQAELRNVLRATYTASSDTLRLEAVRAGEVFTVAFPSNPNTNLTQSTVQSAVVAGLPLGVGVVEVDGIRAARPSSVNDVFLGVTKRGKGIEAPDDGSEEMHHAGQTIEVLTEGDIFVAPEDAVTAVSEVWMRVSASGSERLGAFRGTPDGTAQIDTFTPTAANATHYQLTIRFRDKTYVGDFLSDADGTAAEIVAGLIADLGGASGIPGLTLSGSNTLIITGPAGESFSASDSGVGILARAATQAAVVDCIKIPSSKAHWLQGASAGLPAILALGAA